MLKNPWLAAALGLLLALVAGLAAGDVSRPGGAGHALLFRDHGVVLEGFKDIGPDALTFEAWISTSDYCHASALVSYAVAPRSRDPHAETVAANHFVVFDPSQLVGCHDFEYMDLWPDYDSSSCMAKFNDAGYPPDFVERDGRWHHVAVVWTRADNGLTRVFKDGLLMVKAETGKTDPLQPGGALMLGAEQDCYGGCTASDQGFYGYMDEVRIWRTARSQEDVLAHMRDSSGLENHPDLAAYWKFDDPEFDGIYSASLTARDSSGRGNHLPLVALPAASRARIERESHSMDTSALSFRNNYAMAQEFTGMPDRDITVEFWARTPVFNTSKPTDHNSEFLSYAAFSKDEGARAQTVLLDDALLIERYTRNYASEASSPWEETTEYSTTGSISIHINANRAGNGGRYDNWIDFNTNWTDAEWHHVAVTWSYDSGEVKLYFDGQEKRPFWVSAAGVVEVKDPSKGGYVGNRIAARTSRSPAGSLVLGQMQDGFGGGFSPQYALHGDMADLRIWNRVLGGDEISRNMYARDPPNKDGLAISYDFDPANVVKTNAGQEQLRDVHGSDANPLYFGADAPGFEYSAAPLALPDGKPVPPPTPGAAGHALSLSDQQVLILRNFKDFPSDEVTLEFWMLSTDTCRQGVPFSYATGESYGVNDNSFLLNNYNDWSIGVMEDEGGFSDHTSGVGSTDGRWHHIALTWRSSDGQTKLYDNGREVWSVTRARGKRIPSGGTLVVGREQDCAGGCFDSDYGASGDVSEEYDQEYGAQDFFGVVDEMRLWRKARSEQQIVDGMRGALYRKGMTGEASGGTPVDPHDRDLVAYWNFDEGAGYRVQDITGNGHDLTITGPPRWEVVRWLAVCGNGVVEGLEECDDGHNDDGNGCSHDCKVEPGWECTRTSPSQCWRADERPPGIPVDPHSSGGDAPPPPSGSKGRKGGRVAAIVVSCLVIGGLIGAAVGFRQAIYDHFPQAEAAVSAVQRRLRRQRGGYDYSGEMTLEDALEFENMRPAPGLGPYNTLPDRVPPASPPRL